jgi:hypothetical protein
MRALLVAVASAAAVYSGQGDRANVTLTLQRHGRVVGATVRFRAPCDMAGVEDPRIWDVPHVRLDRRGRFRLSRHVTGGSSVFDVDFAGRIGRGSAAGTFHYHSTTSDVQCDTGVVHWSARRR